jgi:uncharacterized repeat protein (TIGR03803 family)
MLKTRRDKIFIRGFTQDDCHRATEAQRHGRNNRKPLSVALCLCASVANSRLLHKSYIVLFPALFLLVLPLICTAQEKIAPRPTPAVPSTNAAPAKTPAARASSLAVAYTDVVLPGSAFAGVVPGPDGKLYGVTYDGGVSNKGTLYRFDPGTLAVTTLHSFNGAGDGQTPYGELTFDSTSGKLYGTTDDGGPSGVGTIFEFNGTTLTTLKSDFAGYSAPQGGLVKSGGFFYGTLARPNGAVFRMAPDGSGFTIIHAFTDFSALPQPLTLGADGKLYGVTVYGGVVCDPSSPTLGCGTVFRLEPVLPGNTNEQFQTLYQFQFSSSIFRSNYPQGKLVYGSDGYLYGATFYYLFRLNPSNPAATFQFIWTAGGGTSLSVIEGSDGRLYVADYDGPTGAGRILSLNKDGTNITVLHDFSFTTGSKSYGPYGRLYRDAAGTVYGTTEYTDVSPFHGVVFTISDDLSPKLKVSGGDILVGSPGQGIILRSPSGNTCRLLSIDNAGAMVLAPVTCP